MTTDRELIIKQGEIGIFNPPDIVLANAMSAAKALQDVIAKKPDPVIMNGQQYLEFDDWQLCGQFYGYTVKTGNAVPVEVDNVKGAKAHADLINLRTGEVVGGAEAYCMRDEPKWNTRPKYEWQGEGKDRKKVKVDDEIVPWFQLASMAQTRAGAKALRNRLAWVVVLAGYKPTPAEEIADGITEKQAEAGHWCPIHNTAFFKKGKMKSYAHPIGDTGQWCSEPSEDKDEAQDTAKTSKEPQQEDAKAKETKPAGVAVPEITYQSVYKEIKELIAQNIWKQSDVLTTLGKLGGTGQTGLDKIKSLPMEKLLQLSARVKEAKKSHLAEAAKQMGAAEVVEPGDIPY